MPRTASSSGVPSTVAKSPGSVTKSRPGQANTVGRELVQSRPGDSDRREVAEERAQRPVLRPEPLRRRRSGTRPSSRACAGPGTPRRSTGAASVAPSMTAPGPLSTAIARRTAVLPSWDTTRIAGFICLACKAICTLRRSLATTQTIALAAAMPAAVERLLEAAPRADEGRCPRPGPTTAAARSRTRVSTTTCWPPRLSWSTMVTPMPSRPQTMMCPASPTRRPAGCPTPRSSPPESRRPARTRTRTRTRRPSSALKA